MKIVIVGNGIAGLSAAEEIRKRSNDVEIHMITQEKYYTYLRTQLSHFLAKDFKAEELYMHPKQWYQEKKITVHLNSKVEKIDRDSKMVFFNGQSLAYDRLLLSTGAYSFLPPVTGNEKEGVFVLRDIKDLLRLQGYAKEVEKGLVIGGGLLGLEAAYSLKKLGMDIQVVEMFDRLLPRQLDEEGSQVLRKVVEEQGIQLLLGAQVEEIIGNSKVTGCILKDKGKADAQLILFSAGVRSNIQLAKDIGIEVDRGIVVDENMQTSIRDIYAAGDACEYNNKFFGIWPIAMEQGRIAGANMMNERKAYQEITPSNMLNVMGTKVFSIGDIGTGQGEYTSLKEENEENNIFKKYFFKDGKLVGAILINELSLAGKLKNMMGKDYHLIKEELPQESKTNQF